MEQTEIKALSIKNVTASRAFLFNPSGQLLVVGKNASPLHLPGGWCDKGELITIACCREIEEETGLITTHQKVIFVEEAITDDSHSPNGLLHRIDFFSIVQASNFNIEDDFVDHDGGLITHRKFITEEEWQTNPAVLAPKQLKSLSFKEIQNMPSCYSMRQGGMQIT